MSQTKRIVVLISGSGSNLQSIIDACKTGFIDAQIVGVISNQPKAYGLTRATDEHIPNRVIDAKALNVSRDEYDMVLREKIDEFMPDLVVLAGFMRILSAEFVSQYEGRLLNIHPSLLPKYKGLHTHQRAIDAGDKEHGVSVHFVTAELDGGPVVLQAKVPVFSDDNTDTLATRVQQQEHQIYPLVVKWFIENRLEMKNGVAILDGKPLPEAGYAAD